MRARRGLRCRPEHPSLPLLPPRPPFPSGLPPQAGRLQTWMVSGLSPSHCRRLLALVRHTTCRCWMPSPQVAEHCHGRVRTRSGHSSQGGTGREMEEGGSELQPSQCPGQKGYRKKGARSPLDQREKQGLLLNSFSRTAQQLSKYSRPKW